ncbi:MAG: hypothetical protein B6D41_22005, partial [Chloroflexi bacterium UTCFX4]
MPTTLKSKNSVSACGKIAARSARWRANSNQVNSGTIKPATINANPVTPTGFNHKLTGPLAPVCA